MDKITEVGHKMRSAIKAKLIELGCYVDDELPDYIMVMVANHRSKEMMLEDLQLFLDSNTQIFVNWLHHVLQKLHEVTVSSIDIPKITKQEARLKRKIVESKKNKTNESLIDDELKNSTKHEVKIKTLKTENKTTPSLTDDLPISAKTIVERQRRISLKTKEQEPEKEKETIVSDNNQLELAEIENKILEAKNKLAELEKNDNDKNVIDDDEFINIAAHDDELQFDDDKDDGCLTPPLLEHHQSSLKINKASEKKVSILDRLGEKKQHKPITSVASSSSEKKIRLSEIKKIENELLYGSSKSKEIHSSSSQINSKRDLKRKSNVHERIGIMSSIVKPISSNSNKKRRREQHTDDDDVDKDADTTTTISSVIKITPRNSKLTKNKIQPNSNLLLKAMADAHKSIHISNINNNNNKPTTNSTTTGTAITTSSDRKNINNKRTLNDTSNDNKSKKKELYTSHYNKNKKDIKTDTNKKLIQNIIIKVNTATSNVNDNNSDHSKQEDDHDKHINKDVQDEEEEEEVEEEEQLILPTSTTNDHVQHEKSEPKQRFIVTLNGVDENKIFKKSLKTKTKKAESDNDKLITTTNDNDNDNDIKEEEYIKRVKISNDDIDDKKIEKKKKRAPSPITFNESDFNTKTNSSSVSTTAIGTATTILKKQNKNDEQREHKCKYWPRCKLKDGHCDGRHEPPATLPPVVVNTSQQRCKTFPLCKYGQHCYYLHPLCKYNLQCTSLNCIYKHTNRSAIQTQIPPSIASTVVAVPVPVTVPIPVANKICKYYPKCTNVQCKYIHKKPTSLPIPCRYGQYCLNQYECNYDHSIISSSSSRIINSSSSSMIPNKYKLKWKSTL